MRNRIEGAPMGFSDMLRTGEFCKENIAMYQAFAKGGAAIVTVGETTVHAKTGRAHDRTTPLDDRDILPSLLEVSDAVKQHGAIPSIELIHPGHWANPRYTTGSTIYSASAGTHHRYGQVYEAAEMDEDVIEEVVESFGQAAYMGKIGGFEMCMIHGAHGWLISQFLSPQENRRKDRFGGSLENRARLPLMIIDRIRRWCGPDFPIEFRMSGKESADGEEELRESAEFARMIDGKVDLIHVSVSSFAKKDTVPRMFPTMFLPHGCNADISAYIKSHVKTPVVTVGRIGYPEQMEEIIASGRADVVAMVRGLMADPELPRKAREGREDEIVTCLRCNTCLSETFVSLLPYASRAMKCAVNPTCGREFQARLWEKPRRSYKVLIAGGGPGGMQAAITAAGRGHDVVLCEKSPHLGGALATSSHIPFKADVVRYRDSLVTRLGRSGVKVKLDTAVDPHLISVLKPDVLIAAIGAVSAPCRVKGSGLPHVMKVEDVYLREDCIGQNVVIIGGGMSGVEEGLSLAMKGRSVTVVEMLDDVARDANFRAREALMQELEKYPNLVCMTGANASEITGDAVLVERSGTTAELAADTVIIAVGRVPLNKEAESLRELVPDFAITGDCRRVGKIIDAVRGGYSAAMNIY
jgi:2,4-dienoyl-CoA reductase-like NADH-dependent reductase (Old Yellow Enzyme family)/thioredoxin reductase